MKRPHSIESSPPTETTGNIINNRSSLTNGEASLKRSRDEQKTIEATNEALVGEINSRVNTPPDMVKVFTVLTNGELPLEQVCKLWNQIVTDLQAEIFDKITQQIDEKHLSCLLEEACMHLPMEERKILSKMTKMTLLRKVQQQKLEALFETKEALEIFQSKFSNLFDADFFVAAATLLRNINLFKMCATLKNHAEIDFLANKGLELFESGFFETELTATKIKTFLQDDNSTTLKIRNCGLTDIPKQIKLFKKLDHLSLSHNKLHRPQHLDVLALKNLNLCGNHIDPNWLIAPCGNKNTSLTVLNLAQNQLKDLPAAIWQCPNIDNLSLGENALESLPSSIEELTSLRKLCLKGNQLSTLPESFSKLSGLVVLDLSKNLFSELPDLSALCSLRELILSSNPLTAVPGWISKLPKLQILDISKTKITEIPVDLLNNPNLTIITSDDLTCSSKQASFTSEEVTVDIDFDEEEQPVDRREIVLKENVEFSLGSSLVKAFLEDPLYNKNINKDAFENIEKWLEHFNLLAMCTGLLSEKTHGCVHSLAWEGMRQIAAPDSNGKYDFNIEPIACEIRTRLNGDKSSSMNLASQNLTSIPSEIGLFSNLTLLNLKHNSLRWPQNLEQLEKLSSLKLAFNCIDPNWVFSLGENGKNTILSALTLAHNQLESFPKILSQLPNLKTLSLSENLLEEIPASINQLSVLEKFSLSHNKLRKLPEELGELTTLSTLHLHNNNLSSLPESFHHLIQLQELNIAYNSFEEIPVCITKLSKLQRLNIAGNPLTSLPKELLRKEDLFFVISLDQQKLLPWNFDKNRFRICSQRKKTTKQMRFEIEEKPLDRSEDPVLEFSTVIQNWDQPRGFSMNWDEV